MLAYHLIQSFSPGEVTPEQAHNIGCEFARRYLAERYEVTVSTHLDKSHLHNHIVFNSVAFVDGKMYRNQFRDYYQGIRQISDDLCRENRLKVIDPKGHGKNYAEWAAEKAGRPTVRGTIRAEVSAQRAEKAWGNFEKFFLKVVRFWAFFVSNNKRQVKASPQLASRTLTYVYPTFQLHKACLAATHGATASTDGNTAKIPRQRGGENSGDGGAIRVCRHGEDGISPMQGKDR